MQNQYYELLPDGVKSMVLEVEALIGSEISFRLRNDDDFQLNPDRSLAQCDCLMSDGITTVTIALPASEVPSHILSHEVIHAYRRVVSELPYLGAATVGTLIGRVAGRIENDIEHLFVIPLEIAFAPEARQYWESHYDFCLAQLQKQTTTAPELSEADLVLLRETLLRCWLVVSTVIPAWSGMVVLSSMLKSYDWLNDAVNLVSRIDRLKPNKPRCVSAMLRFCRFDPAHFRLSQFSKSEGKPVQIAIPTN